MATDARPGSGRTYRYAPLRYFVSVVISNLMLLLLLGWAINGYVDGAADWRHQMLLIAVPIALGSAFLGIHLPTRVVLDDDGITFAAYGRSHRYRWAETTDMQVRPFPFVNDRFLIRFRERPGFFGGRYWIHSHLHGYEELKGILEDRATRMARSTWKAPERSRRFRWGRRS